MGGGARGTRPFQPFHDCQLLKCLLSMRDSSSPSISCTSKRIYQGREPWHKSDGAATLSGLAQPYIIVCGGSSVNSAVMIVNFWGEDLFWRRSSSSASKSSAVLVSSSSPTTLSSIPRRFADCCPTQLNLSESSQPNAPPNCPTRTASRLQSSTHRSVEAVRIIGKDDSARLPVSVSSLSFFSSFESTWSTFLSSSVEKTIFTEVMPPVSCARQNEIGDTFHTRRHATDDSRFAENKTNID